MNKTALIVAGGSGTRMESNLPKQFLLLVGKPILMHTIEAFHNSGVNHIVLVLPKSQIEFWNQLCQTHQFTIQHQIVAGGASRFESVQNGLQYCNRRQWLNRCNSRDLLLHWNNMAKSC